jgi:hypothetical protein
MGISASAGAGSGGGCVGMPLRGAPRGLAVVGLELRLELWGQL